MRKVLVLDEEMGKVFESVLDAVLKSYGNQALDAVNKLRQAVREENDLS